MLSIDAIKGAQGDAVYILSALGVFEEDEAEDAAESSSSKCWPGYTYFVQLNWVWKVEFSINHFCNFIPSY